ncbi:MAG: hypothetical protein EBZ48_15035, partial [Proteobacteria bacterium]|nr:hypothetical protein [Pseudomonadota bacterium]
KENARFRYLMHLDGVTAADRLRILLGLGATVIKNKSPYYEFYYPLLKPDEHYVEVRQDLSDLSDTLSQLQANPARGRAIAEAGARFVSERLRYEDVLQYTAELLCAYRELWSAPPKGDPYFGELA